MLYMRVIEHACECHQCLNYVSMYLGAFLGLAYILFSLNINIKLTLRLKNFYCDRWCLWIMMPWRHMKPTSEKVLQTICTRRISSQLSCFMKLKRSLSLYFKFMDRFLKREEIVKCLWSWVFCKLNWPKFKFKTWWRPKKCLGIKGKCF
jgi:hypothetical protein